MSQNYINYSGGLRGLPNPQDSSAVESLTGSLICPGPQTPTQQSYPQAWHNGQIWSNYTQQNSEYRMHYQEPPIDDFGYFKNQEHIPYDEAEDFYDNGHADTVGAFEQGVETSSQRGDLSILKGSSSSTTKKSSFSTPETDGQRKLHDDRSEVATSKPDSAAINDRAAKLRAKLLATKRGSKLGTPSNINKSVGWAPKSYAGPCGSVEALQSNSQKTLDISRGIFTPMPLEIDDANRSSSVMQLDGGSDIDVLFAEARAANAASTAGTGVNQNSANENHVEKKLNGTSTNAELKPMPESEAAMNQNQQLLNKNWSSSDASKLGEVRHSHSQSIRAPSIELPKAKNSGHKGQPSTGKSTQKPAADSSPKNQQSGRTVTVASGRPASRAREMSPQPREAANVYQSSSRTFTPQYHENRQASKADYRRERTERPQLPQDARLNQNSDPKRHSGHWEDHRSPQNQLPSHAHADEPEHVSAGYQEYDEYDFQASSRMVESNARAAAIYKKELDDKAQARRMISFRGRMDSVNEAGSVTAEDNKGVRKRPASISTATKAAEKPTLVDYRHLAESPEDLEDWLELTSYYDIQLRNQRLALFRELKAADAHRAQLQRQAEQLGIAHTQPLQPQESNQVAASQSIAPPQNHRASSAIAMPPPRIPSQEGNDDLGIKIKNSANRENISSPRESKRVHVDDDLETGHSQPKTRRLDFNGRDGQSRPQLDAADSRREQNFSEDRSSVDDRNYRKRSRERIRSPQSRRRSLSPASRPRERHPSLSRIEAGDKKSEKHIHESISRLREYEQKPRYDRDNRSNDFNPRWNCYRPNAQYNQEVPNGNDRGSGRGGSGGYYHGVRGAYKPQLDGGENDTGDQLGSISLNLGAHDSRYFMIKSWNIDNVETAQRDCIWATQPKNTAILTEAFNTCRNVILFFSVNLSKAFQGYARMASAPSEDNPLPAWSKPLIWEASPPFHIQWIVTKETPFVFTGHLKNDFNEGRPVLVGKDGQEIEPGCGQALCEVIDEEAKLQNQGDRGPGAGRSERQIGYNGHEGRGGWRGYDGYRGRGGRGKGFGYRRGSSGPEEYGKGHGGYEGRAGHGNRSPGHGWVKADNNGWMGKVEGDDRMDWA